MTDDVLRKAYRLAHAATNAPHVSEANWEGLACGDLARADRDRALAHITSCPECAEIHRSLLALGEEAATFDRGVPRSTPARATAWRWGSVGGLAAAAALVAAVLVNRPAPESGRPSDVTRASTSAVVIELIAPASGAPLVNRHLAWQPAATADAYEVRINAADGGAVWSARVTGAETDIPSHIAMSAGSYYCQVTALRENAAIGSSALVPFRVH